ncbi:MAG: hypothetical protein ACKVH0_11730, partial [Alphaproteobacteria bacterium]
MLTTNVDLELLRGLWARFNAWRQPDGNAPIVVEAEAPPLTDANRPLRMDISFSDANWWLSLSDRTTRARVSEREGSLLDEVVSPDGQLSALDGLKAALRALAPGERGECGEIVLWPIDPSFELFDSRAVRALATDGRSLRKLAERLAGEEDAGIDAFAWPLNDVGSDRNLIAVCRRDAIRNVVNTLGDMAPYMTSLSPFSAAMIEPPPTSTATLFVGIDSCLLIIADPNSGAVVQRSIQSGVRAWAAEVASVNSLPYGEAVREMASRDMLKRADDAGAAPAFVKLTDTLTETFAYMADSRLASTARSLSLVGAHQAVLGLDALIASKTALEVSLHEPAPQVGGDPDLNILRGVDGALFSVGAREYRFQNGRFAASVIDEEKTAKASVVKQDIKVGRFSFKHTPIEWTPKRLAAAGLGIMAFVGFVGHESIIAPANARARYAGQTYAEAQGRIQGLSAQAEKLRQAARQEIGSTAAANKILWAEKFAAIAEAMPPSLWLTNAAIVNAERRVGKIEVLTTKLVLKGMTNAPGKTRLQDIASFIDALERDGWIPV